MSNCWSASTQEIESLLVNWSGPDLSGFGELVLEGSFKVQRVKKERAFFLFDKMLLIAKKRLEQFVYSTHIFVRASEDCGAAGKRRRSSLLVLRVSLLCVAAVL